MDSSEWRRWARAVALAVLLAVAGAGWWRFHDRTRGRLFRIGYQYSPPAQLLDAQNLPTGPVPEAINEAAARSGIGLEWIFSPEGPDKAFAAGKVDLWPLIIQRPDRRGRIYISEPYLRLTYWVVTREGFAIPADWSGKRVARGFGAVTPAWADRVMAGSQAEITKTQREAMEAVCEGKVDVAVVAEGIGDGLMMSRPPACRQQRLALTTLRDSVIWLGVGAAPGDRAAVQAADVLRGGIGAMTRDGRFASITLNWDLVTSGQASTVYEYTESRRAENWLRIAVGVLALGLALLILQQIRVRRAKAAAETANRAKSVFLANMSHEIRTPMNGILGMSELMLRSPLSAELRDYAETIRQSGKALLELINGILDLAKVEAGKMELRPEPFDPAVVLRDVARLFRARAVEKGLDLKWEEPPAPVPWVSGDALRVRQILANLTGNAVTFTEQGGVVLRLEVAPAAPGAVALRYRVSDTGIGIAPEDVPRLFDAFAQAQTGNVKPGGSGLGLAISRKLASLMGGRIEVSSEPGRGSTFTFEVALPGSSAPAASEDRPGAAPERPIHARVLVVEDNIINQKLVCLMLEKLGCFCEAASSGPEALALTASRAYDLVLMDWQMPGMDGLEAARRMKAQWGADGQRPIVAVTASAMQGDREACLAAGMSDYLPKPIEIETLARVVARWARESAPAAE